MVASDNPDAASAISRNAWVLNEREAAMKYSFMGRYTLREEVWGFIKATNKDYTTSKRVKNNENFIEIISQLRVVDKSSTYCKYSPATRF